MQLSYRLALPLAALSARTHALPGWPAGGTLVAGNAGLFDRSTWEANLASPNATGGASIAGYDITQRWPGQAVDGWTLSLNVSRDIPGSERQGSAGGGDDDQQAYTGTSIFLRGPESVRAALAANASAVDDETTWKICVVFIPNGPQQGDGDSSNGTCTDNFLSAQCVGDLQQAYADKFAQNQDCYGTPPSTPSSCGDVVNTANFSVQQFPLDSSNGTEVFVTASDGHDPGDDEAAWANATGKLWPVLTIWGWNVRAGAPEGATPTAQLACIRADQTVSGGDGGSSSSPASGASRTAGAGSEVLALAVACLAACFLL
ncbi:hypothetical protein F4809DRAFT_316705 [Biscogniauxia mediterranea]|nr:hypothetical protein F4809DRAFT_316705 [Biscogniauxia mediterranea]